MGTRKERIEKKFQPKGEPKVGRKTSVPKVTKPDELSSAHQNEAIRKVMNREQNNRGGRV